MKLNTVQRLFVAMCSSTQAWTDGTRKIRQSDSRPFFASVFSSSAGGSSRASAVFVGEFLATSSY